MGEACVAARFDDGHVAAADAAADDAGKRKRGVCRPVVAAVLAGLAAFLDPLPEFVVDDLELGGVLHDPLVARHRAGLPLSRVGVAHVFVAAVDDEAAIELVVENAVSAGAMAVDGSGAPVAAARPGYAFAVERGCDVARAFAVGIEREDAADDGGLFWVDLAVPAAELASRVDEVGRAVAVGDVARNASGVDRADLAAARLGSELVDPCAVHVTGDRYVNGLHFALVEGEQADLAVAQALVDAVDVLLVARDAVERFRDDDVDVALLDVEQQRVQTGLGEAGRGGRLEVGANPDDDAAHGIGALLTEAYLVFDRGGFLEMGRVAGVDRDAGAVDDCVVHCVPPSWSIGGALAGGTAPRVVLVVGRTIILIIRVCPEPSGVREPGQEGLLLIGVKRLPAAFDAIERVLAMRRGLRSEQL